MFTIKNVNKDLKLIKAKLSSLKIKKLQSLNTEIVSNNHLQKHTDNILSKL